LYFHVETVWAYSSVMGTNLKFIRTLLAFSPVAMAGMVQVRMLSE
jgi:hypothetical protein